MQSSVNAVFFFLVILQLCYGLERIVSMSKWKRQSYPLPMTHLHIRYGNGMLDSSMMLFEKRYDQVLELTMISVLWLSLRTNLFCSWDSVFHLRKFSNGFSEPAIFRSFTVIWKKADISCCRLLITTSKVTVCKAKYYSEMYGQILYAKSAAHIGSQLRTESLQHVVMIW